MNKAEIFFTNVWWTAQSVDKPSYEYIVDKYDKIDWQYEGYFNIINPQTATVRVKFKVSLEFPTEFNYLIIKNNSLLKQRSYWFIENYRFLSDGMYQISLRRDIWANFNVFDYDNLKNGALFCKRTSIQRYFKDTVAPFAKYNPKWGLFLVQDNIEGNNFWESSGGFFVTTPYQWPNTIDTDKIMSLSPIKKDGTPDLRRRYYVYALILPNEGDLKAIGQQNTGLYEEGLSSLLFLCALPSYLSIGESGDSPAIYELARYLQSPKLQGLFLSPVPFLGENWGKPIPNAKHDPPYTHPRNVIKIGVDTETPARFWEGIPINSINDYAPPAPPPPLAQAVPFSSDSNTWSFNLKFYDMKTKTNGFTHALYHLGTPARGDKLNYLSEPKLYMTPYREMIWNNYATESTIPYEWNWLYGSNGEWDLMINPTIEGAIYEFRIAKSDFQGADYNDKVGRLTMKNTLQIANLSNPYTNYMQQHINSYNTSMGLANMNQEGVIGINKTVQNEASPLQGIPLGISSMLGTIGNLFTGGETKKILGMRAKVADLKDTTDTLKNSTNTETIVTVNRPNEIEIPAGLIIDDAKGTCLLSDLQIMIKKPSLTQQEKIAYHYHMNGYNVEDIPLTKDDLFTRHNFNFFMVDNLLQVWDVEEVLYQPWIYDYFQKLFQEGVRIWTKAHFDDGNKPLDYSVANWEEVLID